MPDYRIKVSPDTLAYPDGANHKLVVEFAIPGGANGYHRCEDLARQHPPDGAGKGHRVRCSTGLNLAGET